MESLTHAARTLADTRIPTDPEVGGGEPAWWLAGGPDSAALALTVSGRALLMDGREWRETDDPAHVAELLRLAADVHEYGRLA